MMLRLAPIVFQRGEAVHVSSARCLELRVNDPVIVWEAPVSPPRLLSPVLLLIVMSLSTVLQIPEAVHVS